MKNMQDEINWEETARNLLKAELKKRGISYEVLKNRLGEIGINKTANSINLTINKGKFSFVFFLQCAIAIGLSRIELNDLIELLRNNKKEFVD